LFFTDQYINDNAQNFKNFGGKKLGGLILIGVIIIAFGFGGFGGGFSTNNQNNIAKINKKNVTTQDFMNYLNESRISQQAIRENIDNNIIEELLSGLISTTLISLEVEELDLSITELTVLKKIKENKNFLDENNVFQRTKYEKFLLTNNMSAPMYELQLKNKELQKHLFDFIGAGTITPEFLLVKKFEEANRSLNIEYFPMEKLL
jgi:peptidyl-prolyl cis-trans isomerase D